MTETAKVEVEETPKDKKESVKPTGAIPDEPREIKTVEDLTELCLPEEVAQLFRVQRGQVMTWLRVKDDSRKNFPNAFKIMGNRWRIPKQDVIALLRKMYGSNTEGNA